MPVFRYASAYSGMLLKVFESCCDHEKQATATPSPMPKPRQMPSLESRKTVQKYPHLLFFVQIWVALWGWGWAQGNQPDNLQVLDRCQAAFGALRPQFMYAERVKGGFLVRLVLGWNGIPATRLTLDSDLQAVQLGLEDSAVQAIRPVVDRNRILTVVQNRFDGLGRELSVGNWFVGEPKGYRCFVTLRGRVVGVVRLNLRFEPLSDPRWYNIYSLALLRYPVNPPVVLPGQ